MEFQDNTERKEMHRGDWTCGNCGAKIDRLPFVPDQNRLAELRCLACYRASRDARYRR